MVLPLAKTKIRIGHFLTNDRLLQMACTILGIISQLKQYYCTSWLQIIDTVLQCFYRYVVQLLWMVLYLNFSRSRVHNEFLLYKLNWYVVLVQQNHKCAWFCFHKRSTRDHVMHARVSTHYHKSTYMRHHNFSNYERAWYYEIYFTFWQKHGF